MYAHGSCLYVISNLRCSMLGTRVPVYRYHIFSVHCDGRQLETSTGVPALILPACMVLLIRAVQVWLA